MKVFRLTNIALQQTLWALTAPAAYTAVAANNTLSAIKHPNLFEQKTFSLLGVCSDGTCDFDETATSCPQDCADLIIAGATQGNRGAQGVMFKLKSKRDVTVKSFNFYTDAARTGTIEVYTRAGTYVNNELVESGWTRVYNKGVNQNGQSVLTTLGDFDTGVTIPSGSEQSFYIVTANYIMYDAGSVEGSILEEDDSLILYEGEFRSEGACFC
jgi:hypothetical protein